MENICKNVVSYLQKKWPKAIVSHAEHPCTDQKGNLVFTYYSAISLDFDSGIKHRFVAIENFGSNNELEFIAEQVKNIFPLKDKIYVKASNTLTVSGHEIDTDQMSFSPRLFIDTNKLCISMMEILEVFNRKNILIEIIDESKIHKTLFISYGGNDIEQAKAINKAIKSHGIKTWFFEDDAEPGQKLHRMMYDGVNNYDRVLLICSKSSLTRAGVLNEIEHILEREAKEGGSEILIPVTLDDFVFNEWAPTKPDIAGQIKTRVITKINISEDFSASIDKIIKVLKK